MVDFTAEIKQAKQTAASTPVVAPPSQSLGQDVVNAVGTGLQFYQQQQARKDLQSLTQKQSAQERALAEGVMGLRDLRQTLVNQGGVSRSDLRKRENQYLAKYSPEMQMQIVGGAKTITGQTLSTFSDEITEKEEKEKQAAAAVQEARFELEEQAAQSSAAIGMSLSGIQDMTDTELRDLHLAGMQEQAKQAQEEAKLARKLQKGQWKNMDEQQKTQEYLAVALPQFANSFSSELLTTVDELGGFSQAMADGGKEAILDVINRKRREIPSILQAQMELAVQAGAPLGIEQQRAFRTEAENGLKLAEELLSDEKYIKMFDNLNDRELRSGLFKMATTGNKMERGAAFSAIALISSGIKLGDVELSSVTKTLSAFYKGTGSLLDEGDVNSKQKTTILNKSLGTEDPNGGFTEEQQDNNYSVVEQVLLGTPTTVAAYAKSGGLNGLAAEIAKAEGKNIPADKAKIVADALFEQTYKRIPAAQMAALNMKSSTTISAGTGRASDRIAVSTDALKDFTLDENTGELVRIDGGYVVPDAVKSYNKYMKDVLKSFEVLGVDSGKIEDFKANALKSFLIAKEDNK